MTKKNRAMLMIGFVVTAFLLCNYFDRYLQSDATTVAESVYHILDSYRVRYDIDKYAVGMLHDTTEQPVVGHEQAIKSIAYFVERGEPLQFILVGFPFKSGNTEKKVLGHLPDMAERRSLEYLQAMLDNIKQAYAPGARIEIFCDGVPFAKILGISIAHVLEYERALKTIAQDLSGITIIGSDEMMQRHGLQSTPDIIAFFDRFSPTDEQVRKDLKEKSLPTVLLQRISDELDYTQGRTLRAKIGLEEIVTQLISREERLRSYIATTFTAPHYIRLSVHFTPDVSKKFGVRLSPASAVTPYHGVMVQDGNRWEIKAHKDVDKNLYEQTTNEVHGISCGYYTRR